MPSLRNLVLTAPYGRDGRVDTIAEVVRHYADLDPVRLHAKDGRPASSAESHRARADRSGRLPRIVEHLLQSVAPGRRRAVPLTGLPVRRDLPVWRITKSKIIACAVPVLVLQAVEEALRRRIVLEISLAAHRADHAVLGELALECMTRVSTTPVRVVNRAGCRLPAEPRHRKRIGHDVSRHPRLDRPTDDFTIEQIEHHRQILVGATAIRNLLRSIVHRRF